MANLFARATANWASANWNTAADGSGSGATPGASDVCMANGFTVTVNANVTVAEVRNDTTGGATAGGGFSLSNAITLTANVYAGGTGTACVNVNGANTYLVGNATGGSVSAANAIRLSGTNNLIITGNLTGGTNVAAVGAYTTSSGTLSVTGNATGGANGPGLLNGSTGTAAVIGNAIANATTATPGISITAAGIITLSGYAQGNDYGPGSAGISGAAPGISNTAQALVEVGAVKAGTRGQGGVTGPFRFASTTAASYTARATSGLTEVILRPIAAVVPAVTDVKNGVVYGDGGYTGTLVSSSGGNVNMSGHMS